MSLVDPFGRRINYLRLSVIDRCNLRCRYCMPAGGAPALSPRKILDFGDLTRVARAAVSLGVEKIRITGGEPLVRGGIVPFLSGLASLPGLERLVLTTNGHRLAEMADALRGAGVESVNVSLDSLRPRTYAAITRGGDLRKAMDGIAAAWRAGFPYIKLNVVVLRGVNDDEAADFASLTLDRPLIVRFIECMPTAGGEEWRARFLPADVLLARLEKRFRIVPLEKETLGGPARYFRIEGAAGAIGLITPLSCRFCADCNRIRITADGLAKGCLFSGETIDLGASLGEPGEEGLRAALLGVVGGKKERHFLDARRSDPAEWPMSRVGG